MSKHRFRRVRPKNWVPQHLGTENREPINYVPLVNLMDPAATMLLVYTPPIPWRDDAKPSPDGEASPK